MPNVKPVNSPTSFDMLVSQTPERAVVVLKSKANSAAVNAGDYQT